MKCLKGVFCILIAIMLLVTMVGFGNHSLGFWKLLKDDKPSYLYMHEDFSKLTWTESEYNNSGTSQFISDSDVRVIPFGADFNVDNGYLTLNVDEGQIDKYPCIKIPYDRLNARENFALNKITYFVVTFDLWSEKGAPRMVYMRNFVYDNKNYQSISTIDHCNLSYVGGFYRNSRDVYSTWTFDYKYISMATSQLQKDRICSVVAVNHDDISKSTVTYYVNGIENELSYTDWITNDSTYISHFEFSIAKPNAERSISIDNFSVYAFGLDFDGDINDVLKEVNFR